MELIYYNNMTSTPNTIYSILIALCICLQLTFIQGCRSDPVCTNVLSLCSNRTGCTNDVSTYDNTGRTYLYIDPFEELFMTSACYDESLLCILQNNLVEVHMARHGTAGDRKAHPQLIGRLICDPRKPHATQHQYTLTQVFSKLSAKSEARVSPFIPCKWLPYLHTKVYNVYIIWVSLYITEHNMICNILQRNAMKESRVTGYANPYQRCLDNYILTDTTIFTRIDMDKIQIDCINRSERCMISIKLIVRYIRKYNVILIHLCMNELLTDYHILTNSDDIVNIEIYNEYCCGTCLYIYTFQSRKDHKNGVANRVMPDIRIWPYSMGGLHRSDENMSTDRDQQKASKLSYEWTNGIRHILRDGLCFSPGNMLAHCMSVFHSTAGLSNISHIITINHVNIHTLRMLSKEVFCCIDVNGSNSHNYNSDFAELSICNIYTMTFCDTEDYCFMHIQKCDIVIVCVYKIECLLKTYNFPVFQTTISREDAHVSRITISDERNLCLTPPSHYLCDEHFSAHLDLLRDRYKLSYAKKEYDCGPAGHEHLHMQMNVMIVYMYTIYQILNRSINLNKFHIPQVKFKYIETVNIVQRICKSTVHSILVNPECIKIVNIEQHKCNSTIETRVKKCAENICMEEFYIRRRYINNLNMITLVRCTRCTGSNTYERLLLLVYICQNDECIDSLYDMKLYPYNILYSKPSFLCLSYNTHTHPDDNDFTRMEMRDLAPDQSTTYKQIEPCSVDLGNLGTRSILHEKPCNYLSVLYYSYVSYQNGAFWAYINEIFYTFTLSTASWENFGAIYNKPDALMVHGPFYVMIHGQVYEVEYTIHDG